MLNHLYITGGRQRKRILKTEEEWNLYERALILCLDLGKQACETSVEYASPSGTHAEKNASILFKGGTIRDGKLYVCTSTEVLVFAVPEFNLTDYISLPCFNDLHHVSPGGNGALLAGIVRSASPS